MSVSFKVRIDGLERRLNDYKARLEIEEKRRKILEAWMLENFDLDIEIEMKKPKRKSRNRRQSPKKKIKTEHPSSSNTLSQLKTEVSKTPSEIIPDETNEPEEINLENDEQNPTKSGDSPIPEQMYDSDPNYQVESEEPEVKSKTKRKRTPNYSHMGRPKDPIIWEYFQCFYTEEDNSKMVFCKKCGKQMTYIHTKYLRKHVSECLQIPITEVGGNKPKRFRRTPKQMELDKSRGETNKYEEEETTASPRPYGQGRQKGPIWRHFRYTMNPNPKSEAQRYTVFCKKCGRKVMPRPYKMRIHLNWCPPDPSNSLIEAEEDGSHQESQDNETAAIAHINVEDTAGAKFENENDDDDEDDEDNNSDKLTPRGRGAPRKPIWKHFRSVPIQNPTSQCQEKVFCKYCGSRVSPKLFRMQIHLDKCEVRKKGLAESTETERATEALLELGQVVQEHEVIIVEAPDVVCWTQATCAEGNSISQRIPLEGDSSEATQPILFTLIEESIVSQV